MKNKVFIFLKTFLEIYTVAICLQPIQSQDHECTNSSNLSVSSGAVQLATNFTQVKPATGNFSSGRQLQKKPSPRTNSGSCTCGMKMSDQYKIVGGQLADEHEWPWVVALVNTGAGDSGRPWQVCGASLINSQYLLTASHCAIEMQRQGAYKYEAYLGTNSLTDPNSIRAGISQIKIHPNYNKRTLENDIALLKLSRPVRFSRTIQPICLTQSSISQVGYSSVVAGWGSVRSGGQGVNKLRDVKVRVLSNPSCARNYSRSKVKISKKMVCASLPHKDACQGDSGGPLFCWNSKSRTYSQIGIVSFGFDCASSTYPGVYTRVSAYIKWIRDSSRDSGYCQKTF